MGCDIHFYVEKREGSRWVSADTWCKDEYGSLSTYDWSSDHKSRGRPFYDGRNYGLFAILANVRNGYGFAGVDTGDGYVPISKPRGLPQDASPNVKRSSEEWDGDGHSHSHFTVAELLAYDWTQVTKRRGWVDPVEWAKWRDFGKPVGWSGGVGGGETRHYTPNEFEVAWKALREERGYPEQRYASAHLCASEYGDLAAFCSKLEGSPYCQVEWNQPYYEVVGEFLGETMPRLWRLGRPEDVRIVFWFDN